MTNWLPNLTEGHGPLYARLARQIEIGIEAGDLPAGAKLPPQRNLAFDIGVTVGTVSRAYSIVRERGLVSGEIGRGTYVLEKTGPTGDNGAGAHASAHFARETIPSRLGPDVIRLDASAAPVVDTSDMIAKLTSEILHDQPLQSLDYIRTIAPDWQRAGRQWLSNSQWTPEADDIVPVQGAHAGTIAVIAAMTMPGDKIAVEELSYANVPRAAQLMGRRPVSVPIDDQGAIPEALDHICAQQHPKVLFLMPSLHNPTLGVMSEARRREIATIARRHNLLIVEDNVYGCLHDEQSPPLAAIAPELTFHVSGFSKSVAAGLRAGWVACPPHTAGRVLSASKLLSGGKTFLMTELAARLVASGAADEISTRVGAEISARVDIVRRAFDGLEFNSHDKTPFIWLKLPEPWLSGTFRSAAERLNVMIDSEDEFKSGRSERMFHRVRIAFSCPRERSSLETGLKKLRGLLDSGAGAYESYD